MLSIWTWIVANRKLIGVLSVLLGAVLYVASLKYTIHGLEVGINESKAQVAECQASIAIQNAAIEKLAQEKAMASKRAGEAARAVLAKPLGVYKGGSASTVNKWMGELQ